MKALIIDDEPKWFDNAKNGIERSEVNFEIVPLNLALFIERFERERDVSLVPKDIDLFIIDVSLHADRDELGLSLYEKLIKEYKTKFLAIVVSIWDTAEFETKVKLDPDYFINKNNYRGFEFEIKVRNTINRYYKK